MFFVARPKELPLAQTDAKRLWAEEEQIKKASAIVAEHQAPSAYDDKSGATGQELAEAKSDWEQLRLTASVIFPSHMALKFNLSPRQRMAAIAHALGWGPQKIIQAGKISKSTLYSWMKRPEFAEFIAAFQYHNGTKDSKELIDKQQYSAVQVLKDLMNNDNVSASTRKDIAFWFYEQKHGKPKETHENVGVDVRKLTEEMMKARGEQPPASPLDLLDLENPDAQN